MDLFLTLEAFFDNLFALGFLNVSGKNKTKSNLILNNKILFQKAQKDEHKEIKVGTSNKDFKMEFSKEINFLQSCLDEVTNIYYENPKLSIIIPFYNEGENIKRLVRSIQRQEIKEIEMIFIDDASNDKKSKKILYGESEKDKRIKIIENKKYRGILYSYAKGISEAKGNYSMLLNSRQMLLPNLSQLYNISSLNGMEINDFSFLKGELSDINEAIKVKNKEEYGENIIKMVFSFEYGRTFLSNKIYRTDLLKRAIKTIRDEYLFLNKEEHTDTLLFICIFSQAKSYKSHINYYTHLNIDGNKNPRMDVVNENQRHNLLYRGSLYLFKYISELKYSSKDIYNKRIRFGRMVLAYSITLCGNKKLKVDWDELNKIINNVFSNKDLSQHNIMRINEIKARIKEKTKNIE